MAETRRLLHVANGSCTTSIIEAAGIAGVRSVWADPLHDGPVPAGLSDAELVDVRARFLADPPHHAAADVAAELGRWRAVMADTSSYDELVLWFEHDLFDQLNLIQLLDWIHQSPAAAKPASLICIGAFPGRPAFKGLGELEPEELAPLLETRQPIGPEQYDVASRAWRAFRDSDPRALEAVLASDTEALPFLGPALRRHLEEFPSTRDGLSRSERRLLELADHAPLDLWSGFRRMHEGETAFYLADLSFWYMAQALSKTSPALVALDVATPEPGQMPRGAVSLTDSGRAVLSGAADRVRLCGVDRWLGGVHLQGHGPLWRRDDAQGRVVHA
jgi:hypothetical protein